jgi:hypothetical protein
VAHPLEKYIFISSLFTVFASALLTPCHFLVAPILCYRTSNVYTIYGFSAGENSRCGLTKCDADHFDTWEPTVSNSSTRSMWAGIAQSV